MLLLLLDSIIALALRGFTPRKMRWLGAAALALMFIPHASNNARADEAMNMQAAQREHAAQPLRLRHEFQRSGRCGDFGRQDGVVRFVADDEDDDIVRSLH